eukprot:CAMPEP_0201281476 /NCGR_PEP_ID=MMETSP1317-20130820/2835_1 /ASSEMBLY_ACC=CAM_ASM_000770 /TAXON_ID=187299 /ORGANISM="Undescribed Undescribed, Strain Undescribed" /LENGTH=221 /DNA_ID=CAMNT_0047591309 /DNA_START=126 /DNA_END=791 /DNA_ORIENTATION=-
MAEKVQPDAIVIFGMHLHKTDPPFIMAEGAWKTPFGTVDIAQEITKELVDKFSFQIETPNSFIKDNTIELQLPFIKHFFPETRIVPIGVPPTQHSIAIAQLVADIAVKKGLEIKIIGSTDLTHYGPNYGFSPKGLGAKALDWVCKENDKEFIKTVLSMEPLKLINESEKRKNACCSGSAAAAITAAKQLGAKKAELLFYTTSYDKSPQDSFVGYAGIVFGL